MKIIRHIFVFCCLAFFIHQSIYSQNWSPFGSGTGWGNCVAVYNSQLYAGGRDGILKWNGASWEPLGVGVVGEVKCLAVYQNKLIVGGSFVDAGNLDVPFLASWDGNAWNDLGGTTNSIVQSLTVWNNKLIIGGYFTQCENLSANYIVQYDGNNFSTLGIGMSSQVMALTTYNSELYAGGFFSMAGGVPVNRLAKWNGNTWAAVGNGVSGIVYALGVHNGNLAIGGLFSSAGNSVSANAIALYDGTDFSALGSGCYGGFYPYVFSVISVNGTLYAGGLYTVAGGVTVNGIAKWNGSSWGSLGSGFYSGGSNVFGAYGLCLYNGLLVATGIFNTAGGVNANNIAAWDGTLVAVDPHSTDIPSSYKLYQNYPNPFNPSTRIQFDIPKAGFASLKIYDITGKTIETLIYKQLDPGNYSVDWLPVNKPGGIYFCELSMNGYRETRKMILIK